MKPGCTRWLLPGSLISYIRESMTNFLMNTASSTGTNTDLWKTNLVWPTYYRGLRNGYGWFMRDIGWTSYIWRIVLDTVTHCRLAKKLESYGIRGNVVNSLEAFLTDRTQQVVIKENRLECFCLYYMWMTSQIWSNTTSSGLVMKQSIYSDPKPGRSWSTSNIVEDQSKRWRLIHFKLREM